MFINIFSIFTSIESNTEWSEWGAWSMCDNTCPSTDGNRSRMRVRANEVEPETESCTNACQTNSVLERTLDVGTCTGQAAWSEWHSASQAKIQIQLTLSLETYREGEVNLEWNFLRSQFGNYSYYGLFGLVLDFFTKIVTSSFFG